MRIKQVLFIVAFCTVTLSFSQSQLELAEKYLEKRRELVFTFTANNVEEIKQLSRIISFDHNQDSNPLTINAIANNKGFQKFLNYNLPFKVNIKANEPKNAFINDNNILEKGVSGKSTALGYPLTEYPNYAQYVAEMNEFATNNPTIARLVNLGSTPGSAAGSHDILCIVLSDNVNTDEAEPRLLYTSSIHGDELAGYPSMLNLINHLIEGYKGNHADNNDNINAQNLINGAEIWINPLANPDGTFFTTNANVYSSIRGNANVIDLNRNYPAPDGTLHPDGEAYQFETTTFMNLANSYHFVLAANFHGGEEVFNYPWDFTYDRTVDDDWWRYVGEEYALNAQNDSPNGYSDPNDNGTNDSGEYFDFLKATIYEPNPILGVTHGADWYRIDGGRQDFMNYDYQCREVTIELSQTKTSPSPASGSLNYDILDMWNYNKNAYIDFLVQGLKGFKGIVKDATSGNPIDARITIVGRDDQPLSRNSWVETDMPHGDFYRLIEAGSYDILIEANGDCYIPKTLTNQAITNGSTADLGDILLQKVTDSAPSTGVTSNITSTTATLNWDNVNGASGFGIQYRSQGSSTWTLDTSASNSLDLTGLSASTTYEFRVNVTCDSNTSAYSSVDTFVTSTVSYCDSTGDNSDRGITNVTFTGETSFNNSDTTNTNSGYEDFSSSISADIDKSNVSPSYTLSVSASSGSNGNDPLWTRVFIDFNGDGDFNDSGESIDLGSIPKQSTQTTSLSPVSISLPSGAVVGEVRMRISSKKGGYPTSCEDFSASKGEVEDYTLNIIDASLGVQDELLSKFNVFPNPTSNGIVNLDLPNDINEFTITVSSLLGQKIYSEEVKLYSTNKHSFYLETRASGVYLLTISTDLGRASKKIIVE